MNKMSKELKILKEINDMVLKELIKESHHSFILGLVMGKIHIELKKSQNK